MPARGATKPPPRPTGAPLTLDDIVATRPGTGDGITRAERIVEAIRAGSYVETAAAAAGVDKSTLYDWLKGGAHANTKHSRGTRLSAKEKRLAAFANAVAEAEAQAEVLLIGTITDMALGGREVVTVTEKVDGSGRVVDTTTKRERLAPNVAAATWRAERRHPEKWGRRQLIEVGGVGEGGVGKIDSPLAALLGDLDAMERRQHEALTAAQQATEDTTGE